jgi:predicted nucleic acid-binding protein
LTYLDSNIVIYLVEQPAVLGAVAAAAIQNLLSRAEQLAVSDLHRFECKVGPLAKNDTFRASLFDQFFASPGLVLLSVGSAVFERAAQITAQQAIRPLDALHLSAAIEAGCQTFLTNDRRLAQFKGIQVDLLC